MRYGADATAVAATAVAGAWAVDADSAWYESLRKPAWPPPSWEFGVVWTLLYATIAYAAGHARGTLPTGGVVRAGPARLWQSCFNTPCHADSRHNLWFSHCMTLLVTRRHVDYVRVTSMGCSSAS
ncbi:tryptophan-rich sensory protein [Streptomyces sp. NPDC059690]|uniref:tryptophan-rich sensory protein n=1 Tax=Streptomyces sp. NPDC059690 TaxID=3346907 RepID=UPI0036A66C02